MPTLLRTLLQPLNLAAIVTWLAVGLGMRAEPVARQPVIAGLMLAWLALFLVHDLRVFAPRGRRGLLLAAQTGCALALCALAPRAGTAPVLLVIVVAQVAMLYPPRAAAPLIVGLHAALFAVLAGTGHPAPLVVTIIYGGFAAFAALTSHYARSAERARDALATVNADLLATRALLVDAARDAERLRVARELHDVAGHTLTALTLNLRALAADPALAAREELRTAQRLSADLMGELRSVVQTLRAARGLDLATAMRALAAPLPRPQLALAIADDVRVDDPERADALLRVVQEALTNSARHTDARRVDIALTRDGAMLRLDIEDDGAVRGTLRAGTGLTGMRERIEALGGRVRFDTREGRLRIHAELPA